MSIHILFMISIFIIIIRLIDKFIYTRKMMAIRDKKDLQASILDVLSTIIALLIIVEIVESENSIPLIIIWAIIGGFGTFLSMRSKQWIDKWKNKY